MAPRVFTEADFVQATPTPIQTDGITNLFTGPNAEAAFVEGLPKQPRVFTEADFVKPQEIPSLASDPIGALTSSDWWLTRPSGERVSAGQALSGPLLKALQGFSFGTGDEIVSGLAAPISAGISQFTDSPMGIGEAYNKILPDVRGMEKSLDEASPVVSTGLEISGALKLPGLGIYKAVDAAIPAAKTLPQALSRIGYKGTALAAEGGLMGSAYGFGKGEGGIQNRTESAMQGAKTGAKYSALLGTPFAAGSEAVALNANKVKSVGKDLQRYAYGARQADYAKTSKEIDYFDIVDDEVASLTKKTMDEMIGQGTLGKDTNPAKTTAAIIKERVKQSKALKSVIAAFDKSKKTLTTVDFSRARKYVEDGNVDADKVDDFLKEIDTLEEAIKSKGKGKLAYLQAQKEARRGRYTEGDAPRNGFNREIYHDLQKAIERYAPEVAGINKKLQAIKIVEPIVKKGLNKEEAKNWFDAFWQRARTSGAKTIMGPALGAGAISAGLSAPAAILASGVGFAANPNIQAKIGRGLEKLSSNPGAIGDLAQKGVRPVASLSADPTYRQKGQQQGQTQIKSKSFGQFAKPSPKSEAIPESSQKISYTPEKIREITKDLPPVVKAIIKVESNYNPRAKSNKGAQGLMQLMPEMQKAFDVKDPYDPVQNVNAGIKLLKEEMDRFKDNKLLAIAAYNAGSPKVERAIKRAGSTSWAKVRPYLASETQEYVRKVLEAERRV